MDKGQFVEHPLRTEWGTGEVLEVHGKKLGVALAREICIAIYGRVLPDPDTYTTKQLKKEGAEGSGTR